MSILLDEMMSRKLGRELADHEVSTVQREGWAGLTNGTLLDAIASHFDVFITMDKGMRYQQHLTDRPFGIIEVRAVSNAMCAPPSCATYPCRDWDVQPGDVVMISALDE
jgi:predicted nuclease of predicted toxin-antitoxin system